MYKLTVTLTKKKSTLQVECYTFVSSSMMSILEHIDKIENYKKEERFHIRKRERFFNKTKVDYKIEHITNVVEEQCAIAVRNIHWMWSKMGPGSSFSVNKPLSVPTLFQYYYDPPFISLETSFDMRKAPIKRVLSGQFLNESLFATPVRRTVREAKKHDLSHHEKVKVKLLVEMLNGLKDE